MSELGVLDDENCIRGPMRNLEKRQAQNPIEGEKLRTKKIKIIPLAARKTQLPE